MKKYIFLDTWVYSQLSNLEKELQLAQFVRDHDYTVILTRVLFAELYNPNWATAGKKDRIARAASFLSNVPCVIVDPQRVCNAEMVAYLCPLPDLPIDVDLSNIPVHVREPLLVNLLRRSELFLQQNVDVQKWSATYTLEKNDWLNDVNHIIKNAIEKGYLSQDDRGRYVASEEQKTLTLLSLDLRSANPADIDSILEKMVTRRKHGQPTPLTAARTTSLCFWYAYVDIDNANRVRQLPSDLGDISNLSLLPYCAAFTMDKAMYKILGRIREPIQPRCQLITKRQLDRILQAYS